ncbi:WGR domain-containing protein [Nitratireductor basaltis]|uniref:WGR domain-containing protein n=2 Tax=Nitratireductor basaltis TaxID=472175 RepID=A0A084U5H0_9HYPH|nr:WGR domain-containing protein [Nitratireductor basaltis]
MRWTRLEPGFILLRMKKPPLSQFLRRIDRSRNMARFYALSVEPDLFGGAALVRQWGRIGKVGRVRIDLYSSTEQAMEAQARLGRSKLARGYRAE